RRHLSRSGFMNSDNRSTGRHCYSVDRICSKQNIVVVGSRDFANKPLAGRPDQNWIAEAAKTAQVSHECKIMLGSFRKAETWIEDYSRTLDSGALCKRSALSQKHQHFIDHILVGGESNVVFRPTFHMHQYYGASAFHDQSQHRRMR